MSTHIEVQGDEDVSICRRCKNGAHFLCHFKGCMCPCRGGYRERPEAEGAKMNGDILFGIALGAGGVGFLAQIAYIVLTLMERAEKKQR